VSLLKNNQLIRFKSINYLIGGQKIHMKTELQTHMRIRHTVDRPRHQCPGCEKTFLEKKTLSRHFKFIHKGHVQKICDICGKIFQTTYLYNDHYR
jgi:hypothetical protein